ncbi:RarD protein, DMT superfamily transporter [Kribbella flavida DSM 17836]|uniref:RarD protein, DMT superfamily transporter n=1 Tax=Kribbella flavida (strain DSM 17836 / JCM 10339 / NBRC 14399) TaxID=479435 RepID=D2PVP0_KRIFD|nr:EamA family transporter RarD [Kribbella flavida]ADB35280.1 RarD protein, DMT superfamily transporter [Kribbella flavida DSM 17836]
MPEQRRGFIQGLSAYLLWGLFPLYWRLLDESGAIELLAHRIVWALVTIALLVVVLRRFGQVRALLAEPRRRWPLIAGSVLISVNWGVYIWGVEQNRVVETSLGYFITPLFTVLLGVFVLGERLRVLQWTALAIAFVAVVGLTIEAGQPPWIALALTLSFGFYGLAKKKAGAGALEGMAVESATMAPVALIAIVVMALHGQSTVTGQGPGYLVLVLLTGPITAVPLLLFGAAATRISMTTLGLLNYIAPIMQFAVGVLVFHEHMSSMRWAGFALVWIALVLFTLDGLTRRRRTVSLEVAATAA